MQGTGRFTQVIRHQTGTTLQPTNSTFRKMGYKGRTGWGRGLHSPDKPERLQELYLLAGSLITNNMKTRLRTFKETLNWHFLEMQGVNQSYLKKGKMRRTSGIPGEVPLALPTPSTPEHTHQPCSRSQPHEGTVINKPKVLRPCKDSRTLAQHELPRSVIDR